MEVSLPLFLERDNPNSIYTLWNKLKPLAVTVRALWQTECLQSSLKQFVSK